MLHTDGKESKQFIFDPQISLNTCLQNYLKLNCIKERKTVNSYILSPFKSLGDLHRTIFMCKNLL